jgi:hypothetical protein
MERLLQPIHPQALQYTHSQSDNSNMMDPTAAAALMQEDERTIPFLR